MATPEELERAKKVAAEIEKQFGKKDNLNNLQLARYVLLVLGLFNLIGALWYTFGPLKYDGIWLVNGTLTAIFVVLFFTSKTYPVGSVAIGLGIYLLIHLTVLIMAPDEFLRGSIWKIMTIILLSYGLVSALKLSKDQNKNNAEILDEPIDSERI